MAKRQLKAEFNNFIKGLITEASPLNFPENASLDEQNFDLSRTGSRSRRLGMAYEPDGTVYSSGMTLSDVLINTPHTYQWKGAGGDIGLTVQVVQFKNTLWFFDLKNEPLSTSGFMATITLDGFPVDVKYSFATVNGTLVIAAGIDIICVMTFENSAFTPAYERIKVRDIWGVQERNESSYETDISYRGGISSDHYYNLQNQSWGIPRKGNNGLFQTLFDPAKYYFDTLGKWPSNSEAVWPALQFQPVSGGEQPFERIFPNLWEEAFGAEIKSAKGYYVIDLLRRGQSRTSSFLNNYTKHPTLFYSTVTLPTDYTPNGATVVTDFAGRIFYAGFSGEVVDGDTRSPNLNNFITFSQLIKNKPDFTKCYQEGDPTSRESNDIVDTDGGTIRISEADRIIGMVSLSTHLIIIANNGVWSLTGGSDYGFTPTNFKIDKLSSFGGVSRLSIVEHTGKAFFWGDDGIYVIAKNQLGDFEVNSITETTIQTLYDNINGLAKQNSIGIYDTFSKKVKWLYKENQLFSTDSKTYELIFDTVLNAFSRYQVFNPTDNTIEIVSSIAPLGVKASDDIFNVIVGSDTVVSDIFDVVIPDTRSVSGLQQIRYLALVNNAGVINFTFSYYNNEDFRDWPNVSSGVDAFAYMLTGESTGGDSSVKKQLPYLTFHMYRTEDSVNVDLSPNNESSCLMTFRWDWSDTSVSNKWSSEQQVYRYRRPVFVSSPSDTYENGFKMITTKNKVRGSGRSFAMYVKTEPYKDCQIVGWNLFAQANGGP